MRIGFTGTQSGMNPFQKENVKRLFNLYNPDELHHGDCIGGDGESHILFLEYHAKNDTKDRRIVVHPPSNLKKRVWANHPKFFNLLSDELRHKLKSCIYGIDIETRVSLPYLERNHEIVNETELMIAAPKEMEFTLRSGTWATIRYAWKVKRRIEIVYPISGEGNFDHWNKE